MLLISLLLTFVMVVAVGTVIVWVLSEEAAPPRPALRPSPVAPPTPAPETVEALVVFWTEVENQAVLDCVVTAGPQRGAPFSAAASIPAHPVLATATQNLLDRWSTTAAEIHMTTVRGRYGPELRLSDGDATINLSLVA